MYTVLIIDDEIYITTLIEKIIDWNAFGMSVIEKADNGITAMELITKLKPDIVIVDVKMPGYGGIELLQKAREQNAKAKFIVISGHKNFEYAKSAIKYNVEDYLLKPINKGELEAILQKLKNILDNEQMNQSSLLKMNDELYIRQNKIRSYFFKELIQGNAKILSLDQEIINKTYELNFTNGVCVVMILKFDFIEKQSNEIFINDILTKSATDFVSILLPYCSEILYEPISTRVIFLVNYKEEMSASVQKAVTDAFTELKATLKKFISIYATLFFGNLVNTFISLPTSLQNALKAEKSRITTGMNKMVYYSKLIEDYIPFDLNLILPISSCLEFKIAIANLDSGKISTILTKAFQDASLHSKEDVFLFSNLCDKIFQILSEYIEQLKTEFFDRALLYSQFETYLETSINGNELLNALLRFIEYAQNNYIADKNVSENPSIRIAKKYINENYRNEISLASVSNVVNLNPVYFSHIFKKHVGVTFIDYVNQYRIEIAKNLLKNVKYNISEVASMVGFTNTRYFSTIFQKIVGINPSDYKSRHST
jgi:two-component system response regulator YesN